MPVDRTKMAEYLNSPSFQGLSDADKETVRAKLRSELGGGEGKSVRAAPTGWAKVKSKGYDYLERGLETLPDVGGLGGGIGGGMLGGTSGSAFGPAGTAAGTFAGGTAGAGLGGGMGAKLRDYLRQKLGWEPEGDIAGAGEKQAMYEAGGNLIGIPFRAAGKAMRLAEPSITAAKESGVPLTIADMVSGVPGRYARDEVDRLPLSHEVAIDKYGKRMSNAFVKATDTVNTLGRTQADAAGKKIKDVIQQVGSPIYKREVGKLSDEVSLLLGHSKVDVGPLVSEANAELQREVYPLQKIAPRTGGPAGSRIDILNDIISMESNSLKSTGSADISFNDLRALRTKWMGIGPQTTELLSKEGQATAKKYIGLMTDILNNNAQFRGGPKGLAAWNRFRSFTKYGAEVFESNTIVNALNHDPEKITKYVKLGDITPTRRVRTAILNYAKTYGTAEDKVQAQKAWRNFQEHWARTYLLKDPGQAANSGIDALKVQLQTSGAKKFQAQSAIDTMKVSNMNLSSIATNMRKAGNRQLNMIYGTDPTSKAALANLRAIGEAVDKMHMPTSGMRSPWWIPIGAMAVPFTKIIYNPTLARAYINIVKRIPEHPGAAAGLIRLYDAGQAIADKENEQESKRVEKEFTPK